jgi:hypothetical protein
MSYHKSGTHTFIPVVPDCCAELDKELRTLQWVQSSISLLERVPSSYRKDTLKTALASMLESSTLESYPDLVDKLNELTLDLENKDILIEELKAECSEIRDNYPEIDAMLKEYPELTDNYGHLRYRLLTNRGFRTWKYGTIIVVLMLLTSWFLFLKT